MLAIPLEEPHGSFLAKYYANGISSSNLQDSQKTMLTCQH